MTKFHKNFIRLFASSLMLIGVAISSPTCVAHDDENWEHTPYGSVRNKHTGLEWGADIGRNTHGAFPEAYIATYYFMPKITRDDERNIVNIELPPLIDYSGGHTDWRPPTVGEMCAAVEAGLLDHLDFTYGDAAEVKAINDPIYGNFYGNRIYWATCIEKYQGLNRRYKLQFAAEPDLQPKYWMQRGAGDLIAVRGRPADHSNCHDTQ